MPAAALRRSAPRRGWKVQQTSVMIRRMDAEFVAFLDKKFQKVSGEIQVVRSEVTDVRSEVTDVRSELDVVRSELTSDIKAFREEFNERVGHIEQSLESLTRSMDRFVKIHEEIKTEQVSLRADIDRIKVVLREKLGVKI